MYSFVTKFECAPVERHRRPYCVSLNEMYVDLSIGFTLLYFYVGLFMTHLESTACKANKRILLLFQWHCFSTLYIIHVLLYIARHRSRMWRTWAMSLYYLTAIMTMSSFLCSIPILQNTSKKNNYSFV